ncbi:hypothetical protein [Streptomyces sp. JB150]|uniref:hypothetical protein n=1 Tax=Streptomyces sp. JB150 TaxID=2714844 RepID=UPI00140B9139|nr:hypothetical protein [Streptomyces sp. JB150]QIJ62587.1 hypothetical protein G7Z13_11470 [Streptomyces sp. JB150]
MSEKPCTKRPYDSRYEARRALLAIWANRRGRTERSSYFCPDCQAWHLTSRKRRRP